MGYTAKQINLKENAKRIDLPNFLMSNGVNLKKESSYYRHTNHSSLIITFSKSRNIYNWIWNSCKQNGTAIDYLMNNNLEFRYDYKKTIEELNKFGGVVSSDHKVQVEDFDINNIKLNKNINRTIAYLNKTRGINNDIIQFFIQEKLISQTIEYTKDNNEIANLAFIIKDEKRNIVGIEKNTLLSNSKFKGIEGNSKYGYGFNITKTSKPKSILYFESAIDLLSFAQVISLDVFRKKLDTCVFVSLGGLKENILNNFQKIYNKPSIFLCTDNIDIDKASRMFCGQVQSKYRNTNLYLPKGLFKDWNDVIRNKI